MRQAKFSATSVLPAPLYTATFGWTHNGRVRSTTPAVLCEVLHPRHHEQAEEILRARERLAARSSWRLRLKATTSS